ncbi:MAG: hypothetical protein V3T72_23565 [Thermoanaerobaculia bacterium]
MRSPFRAPPSRRPNYQRIFPTDRALAAAIRAKRIVGELLDTGAEGFAPRPLAEDAAAFDWDAAAEDPASLGSFTTSALGERLGVLLNVELVPAAHGRIDEILLTVPPFTDDNGEPYPDWPVDFYYERHLRRLIELLGPGRTFTIVCHHYQRDRVREWIDEAGISRDDLQLALSVFDYSIWAQDAYVALTAPFQGPMLAEGVLFPRYDDMSVADDVAAQTPTSALQSYLYFQGGNILGSPTAHLIGADYVWRNTGRAGLETEAKVLDRFSRLFGGDAIALGRHDPIPVAHRRQGLSGIFQPIFHIDMYVTPTGVTGSSGKEIALVGRPSKAREILGQGPGPFDFDEYFQETAEQLEAAFEVRSLPLLPEYGDLGGRARPAYYHLTWNNAVLENHTDDADTLHRVVYMPTFAEDADDHGTDGAVRQTLDDAAAGIWQETGFEVRRMDGLEDLAYGAGSIHCITKTLRRSGFAANHSPGGG